MYQIQWKNKRRAQSYMVEFDKRASVKLGWGGRVNSTQASWVVKLFIIYFE